MEGGSLNILVKYQNYFPVMNKKKDLCNIPNILSDPCPLEAGVHEATFIQKFPSYALSVSHCHDNVRQCIVLLFSFHRESMLARWLLKTRVGMN